MFVILFAIYFKIEAKNNVLLLFKNKNRYIEALRKENQENQETMEKVMKENDRLRHELNEIRETVTVKATLKYKLKMRSKKG